MLVIRTWVCSKYLPRHYKMSIYAAMYYIPILVVTHALIGGLLCEYKSDTKYRFIVEFWEKINKKR